VVLIALAEITPLFFLQMSQSQTSEIDIVLTKKISSRSVYIKGNRNFYGQDPFQRTQEGVWTSNYKHSENKNQNEETDQSLGLQETIDRNMLDTNTISDKLQSSGLVDGATSRWTVMSKLRNLEDPNLNITSIAYVIDSNRERNLSIGKHFSKKQLGEREAFAS
jgi:hypothetical protein